MQENLEIVRAAFDDFLAGNSEFGREAMITQLSSLWDPDKPLSPPLPHGLGSPVDPADVWQNLGAIQFDVVQFESELVDVVRWKFYMSQSEALKAVGLEE